MAMKMARFPIKLPIDEFLKNRDNKSPHSIELDMPMDARLVRIGVHIVVSEEMGVDPKTKAFGKMIVPREQVSAWAEVPDEESPKMGKKIIYILQDDFELPAGRWQYLTTFAMFQGQIVFHAYI